MSLDLSLHNPSALDGLAMRTAAKKKLAASVNTRNLFHRLCPTAQTQPAAQRPLAGRRGARTGEASKVRPEFAPRNHRSRPCGNE